MRTPLETAIQWTSFLLQTLTPSPLTTSAIISLLPSPTPDRFFAPPQQVLEIILLFAGYPATLTFACLSKTYFQRLLSSPTLFDAMHYSWFHVYLPVSCGSGSGGRGRKGGGGGRERLCLGTGRRGAC